MRKRLILLSCICFLVITLAFMPSVMAVEGTLQSQIDAATDGAIITVDKDYTENITISDKAIVLEFANDATLTDNGGHTITVKSGATLTLQGKGTVQNLTHAKGAIHNSGTVTIKDDMTITRPEDKGTYEPYSSNGNSWYTIYTNGTMTIQDNVTVYNNGGFSSNIRNDAVLNITGGTFEGGVNTIKNDDGSELFMSGGTSINTTQAPIMNANKATISGTAKLVQSGTSSHACILVYSDDSGKDVGETIINGGIFEGEHLIAIHSGSGNSDSNTEIKAGEFNIEKEIIRPTTATTQTTSLSVTGTATGPATLIEYAEEGAVVTLTEVNVGDTLAIPEGVTVVLPSTEKDSALVKGEDGNYVVEAYADGTALLAIIEKLEVLTEEELQKYTEESLETYLEYLLQAEEKIAALDKELEALNVEDPLERHQTEVDEITALLEKAYESLVLKEVDPVNPEEPTNPEKSTNEPENKEPQSTETTNNPDTGDKIITYTIIAIVAVLGIAFATYGLKKNKISKKH